MTWRIKNTKESKEAIKILKRYEGILQIQNKKIIIIVRKEEQLLKIFKEPVGYFETVGLTGSNIYFKIQLYKFLAKYSLLTGRH